MYYICLHEYKHKIAEKHFLNFFESIYAVYSLFTYIYICNLHREEAMELKQRMQYLLDYLKLGPSAFADNLGVQRSSISHLLSGRNKPGTDFINKLMRTYPQVNLEWLMNGTGEMIRGVDPAPGLFDGLSFSGTQETVPDPEPVTETPFTFPLTEKKSTGGKAIKTVILCYEDGSFEAFLP